MGKKEKKSEGKMSWWQLSLFGVGCIIGTGFFLGSGIAISMTGPSVLLSFIAAALGTYFVYEALAKMAAKDPQKGSFRTYAKKAYGRWAGFSVGWVYWASEMLIMGSQLTALSIFSRFWFENVPLWVFASGYAVLGIIVLLIGVSWLNRLENIFAVMKIAAILMFVVIAGLALFGVIDGQKEWRIPTTPGAFFPGGISGLWASLIFAFYAFGGIEVMGLMATRLKNPKEAKKAGKVMILLLAVIYLMSIGFAVTMASRDAFEANESPFLIALKPFGLPYIPDLLNGALIIAGFSTMAASLFAITTILVTLAEDRDAPTFFANKGKTKVPLPALAITAGGLIASIIMALLVPGKIYEYITTGAGLMLLYNWVFIFASSRRLLELTKGDKVKQYIAMALVFLAVTGTLFDETSRLGLFISLGFVAIIAMAALKMRSAWERERDQRWRLEGS